MRSTAIRAGGGGASAGERFNLVEILLAAYGTEPLLATMGPATKFWLFGRCVEVKSRLQESSLHDRAGLHENSIPVARMVFPCVAAPISGPMSISAGMEPSAESFPPPARQLECSTPREQTKSQTEVEICVATRNRTTRTLIIQRIRLHYHAPALLCQTGASGAPIRSP
jgi:hypothetical protein